MSLTSRYDPGNREHTKLCARIRCSGEDVKVHQAGAHLDQRSEFYDGPGGALGVASVYIRDSARKIITEAPALMPEVMDLVTYCDFMRDQVAAVSVDKDRSVRAAMARSESCEHHGEEIKGLGEQVSAFDAAQRRADAGRLALLGFLHAVDELATRYRGGYSGFTVGQLVSALEKASKSTHSAHDRAWRS